MWLVHWLAWYSKRHLIDDCLSHLQQEWRTEQRKLGSIQTRTVLGNIALEIQGQSIDHCHHMTQFQVPSAPCTPSLEIQISRRRNFISQARSGDPPLYKRQWTKPSPRRRNAKRQTDCLRRPYKYLAKEEKWKAKEKRKDTSIWMQSSKEYQGEIRKWSMQRNRRKQ